MSGFAITNINHGKAVALLYERYGQKHRILQTYSQNTNLLPPKPKTSLRHLILGIQEFHKKYILAPTDKAANNVVVV